MQILAAIRDFGLVLTPQFIEWTQVSMGRDGGLQRCLLVPRASQFSVSNSVNDRQAPSGATSLQWNDRLILG
jgi:hypothetical protein